MDAKQLKKITDFLGAREEYDLVKKIEEANKYLTFEKMLIDEKEPMAIIDGVEIPEGSLPNTRLRFGYFNRIIRQRVSYAFGRKCTFNRDSEVCEILFDMDVIRKCAWFVTLHGFAWMEIKFDQDGTMLGINALDPAHCFEFTDNESGQRAFVIIEEINDEFGMKSDEALGVRIVEDMETEEGGSPQFVINQYVYKDNKLESSDLMQNVVVKKVSPLEKNGSKLSDISRRQTSDIVMRIDADPFFVGLYDELKTHVDEYDRITSETFDFVKKSPRNPLIVKGYATSMSELVQNAMLYNIIPTEADGSVEVLEARQDVDAVMKLLGLLEDSMYEQSGAAKSDQGTVSYSGSALRMKYAQLDIAAQYLQSVMEKFFDRARPYMQEIVGSEELKVVFDSDVLVNESDTIVNCVNSAEVISKRTILENHPWVHSVDEEIRRLEEEGFAPEDEEDGASKETSEEEVNKSEETSEDETLNPSETMSIQNNQKRISGKEMR